MNTFHPGFRVAVPGLHLAPKGSHTGFRQGQFTSASPRQRQTQAALALAMSGARGESGLGPIPGAVAVRLTFTRKRPQEHYRASGGLKEWAGPLGFSVAVPDLDKQVRAALDAMTDAGWFADDAQVVALDARKPYGDEPSVAAYAWQIGHDRRSLRVEPQ